jgi:hypothetical protein
VTETLLRHWELKLLALAFSAAIWFFVMTTERAEVILSAPVEVQGLPGGLALAGEVPESVDVLLQGLKGALSRLSADQVRARLDLSAARPGEMTITLGPGHVQAPRGLTVLRVMPSRIRVVVAAVSGTPSQAQPRPEAPRS